MPPALSANLSCHLPDDAFQPFGTWCTPPPYPLSNSCASQALPLDQACTLFYAQDTERGTKGWPFQAA
jgi:hypothetical protein